MGGIVRSSSLTRDPLLRHIALKTKARALRRHHVARIKHKWRQRERSRVPEPQGAELQRRVGIDAGSGRVCSCALCGNPRRHFGETTIQERRQRQPP